MVLQDLGDTPPDDYSDDPYPSDNDAYSTRHFDASQLPKPIPILGLTEGVIRFRTEQTIKFAERRINRAMTQEEEQALAGHLYKMEQTKSYFAAAGLAVGTWRWYTTMSIHRYPFYLPKPEQVNPNKFLFIKGPLAQYSRHSWRLVCYMLVASELGKLCGQIIAQPTAARDTTADPKLAQFTADLKGSIAADTQKAGSIIDRARVEENRRFQEQMHQRAPKADQKQVQRTPPAAPAASEDDMSPTAGNDPWSSSSHGDSGFYDSQGSTAKQQPVQREQEASPWGGRRTSQPANDDASPTGGFFQDEVQSQSKPGESAWERLRRAGGPPNSGQRLPPKRPEPARREPREGSTLGDSFAFSESDEDRGGAQEKAQREFDARIQQERQGKDFNERRW